MCFEEWVSTAPVDCQKKREREQQRERQTVLFYIELMVANEIHCF